MGCDIHLFAEIKKKDKWVEVKAAPSGSVDDDPIKGYGDCFYSGRNYDLFTVLAGVRDRGQGLVPIVGARGTPDDVSSGIAKIIEQWDGDGHSHSYYTLNELMTYAYGPEWLVKRGRSAFDEISQQFNTTLDKLCEFLATPGMTPDNIRIVFFFDN